MALFIPGMSCCICGEKMVDGHKVMMQPAFIHNAKDPLFQFNDAVMHYDCFDGHPLAQRMRQMLEQLEGKINPRNRRCDICNLWVGNPEDYMSFACLSSLKNELSNYNFTQYHKQCFVGSSIHKSIKRVTDQMEQEGLWASYIKF